MRVRFSFKSFFCVGAGKNADVVAHARILTGPQIKHSIADSCYLMDAEYATRFHGAEYQIWSRPSLRDIIAANDRIN